jgi:hypothetical protein
MIRMRQFVMAGMLAVTLASTCFGGPGGGPMRTNTVPRTQHGVRPTTPHVTPHRPAMPHRPNHNQLYYRYSPDMPWMRYGNLSDRMQMEQMMQWLRMNGYDAFGR